MINNFLGRVCVVCAVLLAAACSPSGTTPAPATAEGAATTGEAAAAPSAEGSAAAPAVEGGEAAAAPAAEGGEAAAAPAAEGGAGGDAAAAAAAPVAEAPTGDPVTEASAANLHGSWRVDMMGALANDPNIGPEERAMMQAMFGAMSITFNYNPDNTVSMSVSGMGQDETKTGSYVVNSATGNALSVSMTLPPEEGETEGQTEVFTITFQTTNNATMSKEGEAQVMPIIRQN
jgi:hypothetical protein